MIIWLSTLSCLLLTVSRNQNKTKELIHPKGSVTKKLIPHFQKYFLPRPSFFQITLHYKKQDFSTNSNNQSNFWYCCSILRICPRPLFDIASVRNKIVDKIDKDKSDRQMIFLSLQQQHIVQTLMSQTEFLCDGVWRGKCDASVKWHCLNTNFHVDICKGKILGIVSIVSIG